MCNGLILSKKQVRFRAVSQRAVRGERVENGQCDYSQDAERWFHVAQRILAQR